MYDTGIITVDRSLNNSISPSRNRRLTIATTTRAPIKLRQLLIKKHPPPRHKQQSCCIPIYTCPMDGCNPSQIYIVYTTLSTHT